MASTALQSVICGVTLLLISVVAFSIRLFSVVKYESVIHEFDPYFNFRVTKYLAEEGFYGLFNWFDDRTWYPLGRVIGGTMYPGLIWTAGFIWKVLHSLNIPVDVQEVCVFTAPLFSGLCSLATFGFVREIKGTGAGLSAAAFIAMVPSYISRSVAGSFDLEGVAIFALIFVFYMFVKTLNTGSLLWATALCCAYFYMVMSWGGYTFIINLLPIHCLVMIFTGRLSARLYIAYAPLIVLGTLMAASIPVVGFNAVLMSEHFGAFLAFTVLHVALVIDAMRRILSAKAYQSARLLLLSSLAVVGGIVGVGIVGFVMASPTFGWSGRSLTLLDPTYASKYIPIVASVSEHQPPAWNSYFTDLHVLTLLVPTGLVACFRPLTDASLFLVLYGVTAVYFSGIMVRLMLVLAPAACCLGGIAVSECLTAFAAALKDSPDSAADSPAAGAAATASKAAKPKKQGKKDGGEGASARDARLPLPRSVALCGLIVLGGMLAVYSFHCVFVSAEMYSAPSIVLQSRSSNGDLVVFDDFREAYAWLRHNTHPDCKVASWWDYGYQTTAMADRTVIVDNNTWNNTHIATVGRAMSSPEKKAWKIYRSLDVEYVFVIFGGMVGYPSDDINKFLWMVRIGGGVFPEIRERDYLGPSGYRIDSTASKTMLDSLMYKLSYYRFAEASAAQLGQRGFDRVRNSQIGRMDVKLKYFEEVFTSEHWMVRVYRVLDKPVLDQRLPNPHRSKASRRRSRSKSRAVSGQLA